MRLRRWLRRRVGSDGTLRLRAGAQAPFSIKRELSRVGPAACAEGVVGVRSDTRYALRHMVRSI